MRRCVAGLILLFAASGAGATIVSGSASGADPNGGAVQVSFSCTLNGTNCDGTGTISSADAGCSNYFTQTQPLTITGMNLSAPGSFSGTIDAPDQDYTTHVNPGGVCTYTAIGGVRPQSHPYTATWNGTSGTFSIVGNNGGATFPIVGSFRADLPTTNPVFQMTVTGSVTPTTSTVDAQVQFRPADVGTTQSVYVFALAPASMVRNATVEKDLGVQCVLAQLNASGQLHAVSASSLQAYVTGVLSGQGQAVSILNGVPTANIGGATFFVGYGATSSSMINSGVNRSAVTIPAGAGSECRPQAPQTGWWWNTAQGGRGYSIEVAGNHIFFASYLYDVTGRATWLVASGNTSLEGSLFVGRLESYTGGQTLSGSYRAPNPVNYAGDITLAFNDAAHGTMVWPGGTVALERFNIVPNGLSLDPQANQPEAGWWWNPNESGRGFFLEWQGGQLFMAGYMYDDAGNPIWYLSSNTSPSGNLQQYSNTWWQYANGQTLTGTFKPATQINNNVGPVSIQFQGTENAIMTLSGGRTTALRRFRF